MRPKPALALVTAVIAAVTPHLPEGVRTVRAGVARFWGLQVWAVPAEIPEDEEYEFWSVRQTGPDAWSIEQRGPSSPFCFGTWVPLVPPGLRHRWEVMAALETIQVAVEKVVTPWPAPDAVVKAETAGRDVLVWFQDPSGSPVFPAIRITV